MAYDATELDVVIPELWSSDLLKGTYQAAQIINRVQRVDGEVKKYGDILHLPFLPTFTPVNVTATSGAFTPEDLTLTKADLTIDKWKAVGFELVKKAGKQAMIDAVAELKSQSAPALVDVMETDILALQSDVTTNTVGGSNDVLNEDIVLAAIQKLMDLKFGALLRQPDMASQVYHTSCWSQAKKIDAWNHAQITGHALGGSQKMDVDALYGIPIFFNANVANSSGRKNLMFIKHAFAVGVQNNFEFQEVPNTNLAKTYATDVLYGVITRKEDRAVNITTKA